MQKARGAMTGRDSSLARSSIHLAGKIKPNQLHAKAEGQKSDRDSKRHLSVPQRSSRETLPKDSIHTNDQDDASSKGSHAEHNEDSQATDRKTNQTHGESTDLHHVQSSSYLKQEDLDTISEKVQMPSLMLTQNKVKRSKHCVQEAFSVLNNNCVIIDRNMKDLLFMVKDMAQVLYICLDSRFNSL